MWKRLKDEVLNDFLIQGDVQCPSVPTSSDRDEITNARDEGLKVTVFDCAATLYMLGAETLLASDAEKRSLTGPEKDGVTE